MVKKETILCDICNERVADSKCDICHKDACKECRGYKSLRFGNVELFRIITCNNCFRANRTAFESNDSYSDGDFIKETKEIILNRLKKVVMLNNLEKK